MTGRSITLGPVAALGALLFAQAPAPDRTLVVTNDSSLHLQAWQAGPAGYDRVWEARPRAVDPATRDARRSDVFPGGGHDASMVAADVDGDGAADLLVMDAYGVTVYGRTPAYYPFPTTAAWYGQALAVGDPDGDGRAEILTVRQAGSPRTLEIWKPGPAGLAALASLPLPGPVTLSLVVGDADNDGQNEILLGGLGVTIVEREGAAWKAAAELPNIGATTLVRVADVDGDGKNEVVAAGESGRVTIYKARKQQGGVAYPVLWQSRYLAADGLKAGSQGPAMASANAMALADVDSDKRAEIVVGAGQWGKLGEKDVRNGGVLRVFRFEEPQEWAARWTSELLAGPTGVAIGDADGDGADEIVYNGREVLKRDAGSGAYRRAASLCPTCTDAVVARLGELREPAGATRLVPIYAAPPIQQLAEGESQDVALTLLNVWGDAHDISVKVTSSNPRLTVSGTELRATAIPAGTTFTLPPFKMTAGAGKEAGELRLEITAAGGYRQAVPVRVYVGPPLPTFQPGAPEPRIADAVSKARDDNQRVLVQWGSNTDPAARALIAHTRRNPDVLQTLAYEYLVVRVEVKSAADVPRRYRGTGAASLPYLSVLDGDGKLLAGQPASPFKAAGEGAALYDGKKLNAWLTKFKPVYVKAEPLVAEALKQAKGENKALFLWFSAPW